MPPALEMSGICLCEPLQIPARIGISGVPLITEDKTDTTNENLSHEHIVSKNLEESLTSADKLSSIIDKYILVHASFWVLLYI